MHFYQKAQIILSVCVNTQKYKHLQFLLRKKGKIQVCSYSWVHICYNVSETVKAAPCWSSFDVPAFGNRHVEVWGWQSQEPHSNTCSTGWLPPTLPTARILPAWRNPSLRTSLNMPLSYRSADTTLSWRNIALTILTAHCTASPPTRNKRCSACPDNLPGPLSQSSNQNQLEHSYPVGQSATQSSDKNTHLKGETKHTRIPQVKYTEKAIPECLPPPCYPLASPPPPCFRPSPPLSGLRS